MLQQCVGMMAGPTDEHRFVALLVLPRLLGELGQHPENGAAAAAGGDDDGRVEALSVVQAKILEALDWPFFRRLLAPFPSAVDGVELEVANAKAAQMQVVAVAVLSSLCEQGDLSAHPRLADVAMLLPLLAAALDWSSVQASIRPLSRKLRNTLSLMPLSLSSVAPAERSLRRVMAWAWRGDRVRVSGASPLPRVVSCQPGLPAACQGLPSRRRFGNRALNTSPGGWW